MKWSSHSRSPPHYVTKLASSPYISAMLRVFAYVRRYYYLFGREAWGDVSSWKDFENRSEEWRTNLNLVENEWVSCLPWAWRILVKYDAHHYPDPTRRQCNMQHRVSLRIWDWDDSLTRPRNAVVFSEIVVSIGSRMSRRVAVAGPQVWDDSHVVRR